MGIWGHLVDIHVVFYSTSEKLFRDWYSSLDAHKDFRNCFFLNLLDKQNMKNVIWIRGNWIFFLTKQGHQWVKHYNWIRFFLLFPVLVFSRGITYIPFGCAMKQRARINNGLRMAISKVLKIYYHFLFRSGVGEVG